MSALIYFDPTRTREYQAGDELKQTANELLAKVDDPKLQNTEVRARSMSQCYGLCCLNNTLVKVHTEIDD